MLIITRAIVQMTGTLEGATELLADNAFIFKFPITMHGESGFADRIAHRELLSSLCIPHIERDNAVTLICIAYSIVNGFHIVAFVG